ncbi:MAG TPA: DUF4382 domain-containing protein [Gammaproteobacteria bacterium]|nr:DUF4382 domain-containing protein [Gammaproteobacteria bacterium]
MLSKTLLMAGAIIASLSLVACSDDENTDPGNNANGNTNTSTTGKLTLAVTDAPIDTATSVVVQFDGVEVKPMSGDSITFDYDEPRSIDLLALHGGDVALLLEDETVPKGEYDWVRLMITTDEVETFSNITFDDGSMYPLFIPSGAESGLKLNGGFTVPAGGDIALTLDFNLRKSIRAPGNMPMYYIMRPTIRLVDNSKVGTITGNVENKLITPDCTPAVYIFEGADITPDDVDDVAGDIDPVSSSLVTMNAEGVREYTAAFLPAGDYTVAYTCDAALDNPVTDDDLSFISTNAVVTAGEETIIHCSCEME